MGRSVDYLNNAETVIYFTMDWADEDDEYIAQINYEDFLTNLKSSIQSKLKSYYDSDSWDGRETKIILTNKFCNIGLSEYCGLWALSVAPKDHDTYYAENTYLENFSVVHANKIEATLKKCLVGLGCEVLVRTGTFSNGCGAFQKDNTYYENAEVVV